MKVYVASSLFNSTRVKEIQNKLIEHGVEITYDWTTHGQEFNKNKLREYGELEVDGVIKADILFMVHPARCGSHVELGIAIAANKLVVILEEEPVEQKTFYYLDCVNKFNSEQKAISFILECFGVR